jgi:hypothetical protein
MFEVDMRIQIWRAQFEVYEFLARADGRVITQLIMGEGKTQIIIPLLVLNCLYSGLDYIPRINILSQLMPEASSNYYKFLAVSTFQIPILQLAFNRSVNFDQAFIEPSYQLI